MGNLSWHRMRWSWGVKSCSQYEFNKFQQISTISLAFLCFFSGIGLGQLSHTRSLHRWPWRILCRVERAISLDALKWQATMWRTSFAKSTTCTVESQDNSLVLKLVERSGFPVSSQIYTVYSIYIEISLKISLKMLEDNAGPPQTCEAKISSPNILQHYRTAKWPHLKPWKTLEIWP